MGWDANIATSFFKGKLPVNSLNQLLGALRERAFVAGVSLPPVLTSDLTTYKLCPKTFFTTFQSYMTLVFSRYVNHLDNKGNWTGKTTIPNWTQATLLAAIGDGARIPPPSSWQISAALCFQQYKFLNMLRWISGSSFVAPYDYYPDPDEPTEATYYLERGKTGGFLTYTFEQVKSFIESRPFSSWTHFSDTTAGYFVKEGLFKNNQSLWDATSQYVEVQRKVALQKTTYYKPYKYSVDVYLLTRGMGYVSNDYLPHAVAPTKFSFCYLTNFSESENYKVDILYPTDDLLGVTGLIEPSQTYVYYALKAEFSGQDVAKFDGPNGFQFRDW